MLASVLPPLISALCTLPIAAEPIWISQETSEYFTGAALVDLDGDGDQDFVSSAGNDIIRAASFAWHNEGGDLSASATWVSSDTDYSGHCALGDIDADGFRELAVANYIADGWGATRSQLYSNQAGLLESTPSWLSGELFHSFSCAFGDPDGDGDLDLGFACGEQYGAQHEQSRVFFNDGALETTASWRSATARMSYDIYWVDVDRDGDLDLSFITADGPVLLHRNHGGSIESSPSWQSADSDDGNTLCWGDVNNDGYPDLATANNFQLGGDGYFQLYLNQGGTPQTTPIWTSATPGYGSAVALCDLDFDGDLDLATGRWWSRLAIYENIGGIFAAQPSWECDPSFESVVEEISVGDIDGDGVRYVEFEALAVDGAKKVFYPVNTPAVEILALRADGRLLERDEYCADPAAGWVSLAAAPTQSLEIAYYYSIKPDLGVSNWDTSNYLFGNSMELSAPLSVRLRGHDLPLDLPRAGGEIAVDYTVVSNQGSGQPVDLWLMARREGGETAGPFLQTSLWLDPLRSVGSARLARRVPASVPNGSYTLILYAGTYPDAPVDSSSVALSKGP